MFASAQNMGVSAYPDLRLIDPDLHCSMASLERELNLWTQVIRDRSEHPQAYVQRGMVWFKLAEIGASIQDFDRAEHLEPAIAPYLWQRGLSYYYANRFAEGAAQFELDLQVNAQDVEETVWRCLCLAQIQGLEVAQQSLVPVKQDRRPIMTWVYNLFAGNCTPEAVLEAGQGLDHRGKFYSHLYVGLYYEAAGLLSSAQTHIGWAVQKYPLADYMWHLGNVHLQIRGWKTF